MQPAPLGLPELDLRPVGIENAGELTVGVHIVAPQGRHAFGRQVGEDGVKIVHRKLRINSRFDGAM